MNKYREVCAYRRGPFVLICIQGCLAVPRFEICKRMVPPFLFMIHIGKLIEEELHKQERTPTWLARKINCDRTNIYNIFQRQSIDTCLLANISKALNRDFFKELSEEYHQMDEA